MAMITVTSGTSFHSIQALFWIVYFVTLVQVYHSRLVLIIVCYSSPYLLYRKVMSVIHFIMTEFCVTSLAGEVLFNGVIRFG